ncbi:MAG TPA: hypothetical protein VG166_02450 [Caulobacteraceae bacterium]|jgi:hypothetical protein|nr:hypothetical protein [Caulobacteraceae bacterium]
MNDDQTRPSDATPGTVETSKEVSTADLAGVKHQGGSQSARGNGGGEVAAEPSEAGARTPLFAGDEAKGFRGRWDDVQAGFVDEPRTAVREADSLVAEAMTRLADIFASERSRLEAAWDRGDDVSTEDLRLALQRYRSFFGRLLSV